MTGGARRLALAAVTTLVVVLAGCAGLPTSGPVQLGLPTGEEAVGPSFSFIADSPQPGATQEEIVLGFLRAASAPADAWSGARQYLAADFRDDWRPDAGATVDAPGDRAFIATSESSIELHTTMRAAVDAAGSYSATTGGATTLRFELVREGAEWRISSAPEGVLLDSDLFSRVYGAYQLALFDPTWRYLVPDLRWFPTVNAPTRIVTALVGGGPAEWLAGSVRTAFPAGLTVRPSVPVVGGVAQVEVGDSALGLDATTLDRMKTQLDASLESAGISDSVLTAAGTRLPASAVAVRSTAVDPRPLVLSEQGFGFLTGDVVEPVAGLSAAVAAAGTQAVQLGADHRTAALRRFDGVIVRVLADGSAQALSSDPDSVAPSVDPGGYVWTARADAPGRIVAFAPDGRVTELAARWAGAARVSALQVSRDGSRLAAVVMTAAGEQVWVAGVSRDAEGTPLGVGEPMAVGVVEGEAQGMNWVDDVSVALLVRGADGARVVVQPVGGIAAADSAPDDAISLSGSSVSTLRVLTAEGAVMLRRGASWQEAARGVAVLGTVQGTPAP